MSKQSALSRTILERLKRLHPRVIDLSLGRIQRLLTALGEPHRALPPVIHVAGTNGKGSTLAFLRAFFEASGRRVHVYTSPHLVSFQERIRLSGRLIDEAFLASLLEECEFANGGQPITFFEITTAAAFLAFARIPADIVLLETGLGGRLDATNVIDCPAVTAITRISIDHTQYLGETISAIAAEKAGVFKSGVSAVLAPQPSAEAALVLTRAAAAVGAPVVPWSVSPRLDERGFVFHGPSRSLVLPRPGLEGAHQILNAGVALACLECLPTLPVSESAILAGLVSVEWPARLHRLRRGPLVERLPTGWELWLDGGHNDSAGEVLAAQAVKWRNDSDLPLALIFGMLSTKRPVEFLASLAPMTRRLRAVHVPGEEAALSAGEAAEAARLAGIEDVATGEAVDAALKELVSVAECPCRVLICGSLYLAGAILQENA
ncbi:dihydrofolate synthase / folylpolyglutamate synthase [Azospirillaceae bacterium]